MNPTVVNCRTGRALTAYRSVVSGGEGESYDDLKDNLLDAMGLGIEQTRRKFWKREGNWLIHPQFQTSKGMHLLCHHRSIFPYGQLV